MRALRLPSLLAICLLAVSGLVALAGLSIDLGAQEIQNLPDVAQQTGGLRAYWHVFAAYAMAIVLIGGWAISIARRLRQVEERLLDR